MVQPGVLSWRGLEVEASFEACRPVRTQWRFYDVPLCFDVYPSSRHASHCPRASRAVSGWTMAPLIFGPLLNPSLASSNCCHFSGNSRHLACRSIVSVADLGVYGRRKPHSLAETTGSSLWFMTRNLGDPLTGIQPDRAPARAAGVSAGSPRGPKLAASRGTHGRARPAAGGKRLARHPSVR